MKKFSLILLALVLISSQAFGYTITKQTEERFQSADTGDSYVRVIGYFALDSSHPALGEQLLPSQLGLASFSKVDISRGDPPFGSWTATQDPKRFGFDYTNNRFFVVSTQIGSTAGGGGGLGNSVSYTIEISGPVTYNLAYLTRVPFEAVGPIN